MHHPLLLFSFDLLQLAFLPNFDPAQHILLEQPTPATFKVLKFADKLKPLFQVFQKADLMPVCYSSKSIKQTAPVMSSINPALRWAYVHVDNKKLPNVRPNHARLSRSNENLMIEYGEGFSACEGKQQLRIAICSAFKLGLEQSKQKIIIFENNPQQIAKLKQHGFANIYSEIPDEQGLVKLEAQISRIWKEPPLENKQFAQFISHANSFDESACRKISNFHYLENRKTILPTVSLGSSSHVPIFRLPKSTSVCAMVFRYAGDRQLYVGKADLTSKIGGDLEHELQEDKVLESCLHQTLTHITSQHATLTSKFLCLPMFLSHFTMKNCLIKAYNKNKAHFVVKPYFKNINKFSEILTIGKQKEQILEIVKSGTYKQQRVVGLGQLLCLSILFNEQYQQKGFFETVGVLEKKQQSARRLHLYRIQFTSCRKQIKGALIEDIQVKLLSYPEITMKIGELCSNYLQQFKQTVALVCQSLPILQSIFTSQIWNFCKKSQLSNFVETTIQFGKKLGIIQADGSDVKKQLSRMDIGKIPPKILNYLVASSEDEDFQYFTRETTTQNAEMYEYGFDRRSPYEQQISCLNNFAIFGQCIPALSLVKWIKSKNKNSEVVYLSLLTNKSEEYVKQVKMAKASKKNILFILDHCQIEQMGEEVPEHKLLVNSNWGLRTIFMYRMKFGSSKNLVVVHDALTAGKNNYSVVHSKLPQSHEQIFKAIFKYARNNGSQQNAFENYKQAIWLYVKNKWMSLGQKAGISELSEIMDKLKLLVKAISLKSNRLVSILKSKQFNDHLPLAQSEETMASTHELIEPDSQQMASENKLNLDHLKNVSRAQIILYCLPIFVSNQRVWLLHDIHEYLSAYYLHEEIIQDSWDGILEGEQLQNFTKWFNLIPNKKQIRASLIKMIDRFENQKGMASGRPQIMGANSSLNDCLELLKKIGVNHLFCKLDIIFYVDSPISRIHKIHQQLLVGVTQKGSVYQIVSELEKDQKIWKMKPLPEQVQKKQQKNRYQFVGIQRHKKEEGATTIMLAAYDQKSLSFVIQDNKLLVKRIDMKDNNIKTSLLRVKMDKISQSLANPLIKVILIEGKVAIFIFQSGNTIINSLGKYEDTEQELREQKIELKQNMGEIKVGKGKAKLNKQSIKHEYLILEDGSLNIVIAFVNEQQLQNSHKANEIVVCCLRIYETDQTSKWCSQIVAETSLICQNQIKSIGLNYSQKEHESIEVMAFEQVTDALMVWTIQQTEKIDRIYKPDRKLYRIENDPIGVYKYGDILYVASKYNFVKRMLINNSQE